MIITIDGPSGTGKTTIAREVAKNLGFAYFDTGAMYRAITVFLTKRNVDLSDPSSVTQHLKKLDYSCKCHGDTKQYFVDSEDVTDLIRTPDVTARVSTVSALKPVRELVWGMQRKASENTNAVFEGRDMGTVVFPQADLKIFLTATPKIRAERRLKQVEGKPEFAGQSHDQILQDIIKRDTLDSTRTLAPLKQAEDAHLIDTSALTVEQVVDTIIAMVRS